VTRKVARLTKPPHVGHARPSVSLDIYAHVKPLQEIADHELAALLS